MVDCIVPSNGLLVATALPRAVRLAKQVLVYSATPASNHGKSLCDDVCIHIRCRSLLKVSATTRLARHSMLLSSSRRFRRHGLRPAVNFVEAV